MGARDDLLEAEAARCRATNERDWEVLERVIADDLVYTHSTGFSETKRSYIDGLKQKSLRYTRANLSVRVHGDVGLINGDIFVFGGSPSGADGADPNHLDALQVWLRDGSGWRLHAFHATAAFNPAT